MRTRVTLCLVALLLVTSCGLGDGPGEPFLALLTGANELPPTGGSASGQASFKHHGSVIDYSITVQFIAQVKTAAIYAGADTTGAKIADLYTGPVSGTITSGVLAAGTLGAASFGAISLDSALVLMRKGLAFVNVTTTALPSGEIRGQIYPN
jgi:hypothetical protein